MLDKFEKFLYKKINLWFVVFLVLILLFSFFVLNWLSVSGRISFLKDLGNLPHNIKRIFVGVNSDLIIKNRFKGRGGLTYGKNLTKEDLNGYLLLPRYVEDRSIVELIDIRNNTVIHSWKPNIDKLILDSKIENNLVNLKRDRNQSRFMMSHPLMLNDGSLIFMHDSPLVKINFCGQLVWKLDEYFHHSLNLDKDGNIWGLGRNYPSTIENNEIYLLDDTIQQVSTNNGELLFRKSIIKILQENNLGNIFLNYEGFDPIHANDVEIAKNNGLFWKTDDLFISIKHLSLILLYRPSTNKVIWHKQGPWVYQHDVDIIDENIITVFNNKLNITKTMVDGSNEVSFYNFSEDKTTSPFYHSFKKFDIRTVGGGLSEVLDNGDLFIEETNYGRILRISKEGTLKWQYINKDYKGILRGVGFARFLKELEYNKIVNQLKNKKCN